MKNVIKTVVLLLIIGLSSCDKTPDLSEEFTFGIRHDKTLEEYEAVASANSSSTPDFSPVVFFNYSLDGSNNYEYTATGTLIDEEWILTAGHNFFIASDQSSPASASGIQVSFGTDPNNPTQTLGVQSLTFHPTWIADNDIYLYANDLCLVKLATPVTNVTPAEFMDTKTESVGSTIWFSGFGDYSQSSFQNYSGQTKLHAIQNVLDRVVDNINTIDNGTTYNGGLLVFDFDNPSGTINSLGDNRDSPDEDLFGTGTSDNLCTDFEGATVEGDSGGPLFVKDGATWKVAGVLSGGTPEPIENHESGSYGDISVFTRVANNATWINSTIQ